MHYGRVSQPGATYFLTLCVKDRQPVLTQPTNAARVAAVLTTLTAVHDITLLAATTMPDHVHLLFTLGQRLILGQVMAKFKSLARDQGCSDWSWQRDGFDHLLLPDESCESYAFYIFMNPYRDGLIPVTAVWPWWHCAEPKRFKFVQHLGSKGEPPMEWLDRVKKLGPALATGES